MVNHVTICTMPSFLLTKEMVCVGSLPVEAVEPKKAGFFPVRTAWRALR